MLRQAEIHTPLVRAYDSHPVHLQNLDNWRISDAFDNVHGILRVLASEHAEEHNSVMATQIMAAAAQEPMPGMQGPGQANPRGEPSPPRQSPDSPPGLPPPAAS